MKKGSKHTAESIEKQRVSHMGQVPWNKGKVGVFHHTEKTKRQIKLSCANRGQPSEEARCNMRSGCIRRKPSRLGKKCTEKHKHNLSLAWEIRRIEGRASCSEETRKKQSIAHTGKKQSNEVVENRRLKNTGQRRIRGADGYFHSAINREKQRHAGMRGFKTMCMRKKLYLDDAYFMSKHEIYIAKKLKSAGLVKHFVDGVSAQICVARKLIDFRLDSGTFIEYHPRVSVLVFKNQTYGIEYYNFRRKLLDDNGYSKYKLFVFETLKQCDAAIEKGELYE